VWLRACHTPADFERERERCERLTAEVRKTMMPLAAAGAAR